MADNSAVDINSQLVQMGFGRNSSGGEGGGSAAAEGMTHEENLSQAVDKGVQQITKLLSGLVGMPINSDIQGKSMFAGLDAQGVGSGLALSNLAIIRPESGGGWLSMLLDMIKRHLTREIPGGGGAADTGSGGGGGGADTGSFDSGGGGSAAAMSGGGDFPGAQPMGGQDMPDVQVNYGGKIMAGDAMITQLGNLKPDPTPGGGGGDRDTGMGV